MCPICFRTYRQQSMRIACRDVLFSPALRIFYSARIPLTFHPRLIRPPNRLAAELFPTAKRHLIYGGKETMTLNQVQQIPW